MHFSPQQEAIFERFLGKVEKGQSRPGSRHTVIRARAGTGKTTTIVELIKRVSAKWPNLRIVACAFNKEIANELTLRLPASVTAKTLHSLGFAAQQATAKYRVDTDRDLRIATNVCPDRTPKEIVKIVNKLAIMGKECAPLATDADALIDIQNEFDLFPEDESDAFPPERIRFLAFECMIKAMDYDGTVSFSDMVYRAVRGNMVKPIYDMVIVDEAQDMNAGQLILAKRLAKLPQP
jgi:DNA helicase-2/ATP-dependent DNA helicase PcrA